MQSGFINYLLRKGGLNQRKDVILKYCTVQAWVPATALGSCGARAEPAPWSESCTVPSIPLGGESCLSSGQAHATAWCCRSGLLDGHWGKGAVLGSVEWTLLKMQREGKAALKNWVLAAGRGGKWPFMGAFVPQEGTSNFQNNFNGNLLVSIWEEYLHLFCLIKLLLSRATSFAWKDVMLFKITVRWM